MDNFTRMTDSLILFSMIMVIGSFGIGLKIAGLPFLPVGIGMIIGDFLCFFWYIKRRRSRRRIGCEMSPKLRKLFNWGGIIILVVGGGLTITFLGKVFAPLFGTSAREATTVIIIVGLIGVMILMYRRSKSSPM